MKHPYVNAIIEALGLAGADVILHPSSSVSFPDHSLHMVKIRGKRHLLVVGEGASRSGFRGEPLSSDMLLCPASHENRLVLNGLIPTTVPQAFGRDQTTFGVGDRLGIATPGHIRVLSRSWAKPILAQQSKRELALTGRTYEQVLDDVCFSVFQEGYTGGFGADGDHLKSIEEIKEALACGYTMITLDCSSVIGKGIEQLSTQDAKERYLGLESFDRAQYEERYLDRVFSVGGREYAFAESDLIRCVLVYKNALEFVDTVYRECILSAGREIDFELSIDETDSVTTPLDHLFVATELLSRAVQITSLAPRFAGEFQKGIDYIGDLAFLESELEQHGAIADHFGYKLSIHSGSDKFSAFPMIGTHTGGRLHVKTSGTSWLEAVATIAHCDPSLYRKLHESALANFEAAKAFYHVSADLSRIRPLSTVSDDDLLSYFTQDDSRQLLHITYGFLLGDPVLRTAIYDLLSQQEEIYYDRLMGHIGRHLHLLGIQ